MFIADGSITIGGSRAKLFGSKIASTNLSGSFNINDQLDDPRPPILNLPEGHLSWI